MKLTVVLPLALFAALAALVAYGTPEVDESVVRFSDRNKERELVDLVDRVSVYGYRLGGGLVAIMIAVAALRRRWALALFCTFGIAGVLILDSVLKELFRREPLGNPEGDYSFPSGNAMGSAALAAGLVLVSHGRRRWLTVLIAVPLVLVYGAGIVYAGWHYPTDVLAGWFIGFAWVAGLWLLLGRPQLDLGLGEDSRDAVSRPPQVRTL